MSKRKEPADNNEKADNVEEMNGLDNLDDSEAYKNREDVSEEEINNDIDEALSQIEEGSLTSLAQLLKELRGIPLLTREEEQALGQAVVTGHEAETMLKEDEGIPAEDRKTLRTLIGEGEEAQNDLVKHNLRLVVHIAKGFRGRGVDYEDLIEAGAEGLMRAASKFNYTMGNKFSTYATWWVKQGCERYIHDNSRAIRLPVHINERISKVKRAQAELIKEGISEPTVEEIAKKAKIEVKDVRNVFDVLSQGTTSLNTVIKNSDSSSDGEDSTLEYFVEDTTIPDFTDLAGEEDRDDVIERVIADLTDEDATILRCRLGIGMKEPMSQEETGRILGKQKGVGRLSREAARVKENRTAERCIKNFK